MYAPDIWVLVARDADPRCRIGGYLLILHSDRYQLFVRTPSGAENVYGYRAASSIFAGVLWLWFIVVLTQLIIKFARVPPAEQRRQAGLCPSCGYDIRATPDRCPECGATALPEPPPISDPPAAD